MVTLMLVDDQAMVRGALGALLDLEDDLEVVAQAADADEAVERAAEAKPDVCLMDIQLPGEDGIAATTRVLASSPGTCVLIVTTFARPGYLHAALAAGASGFVVKDAPATALADAVRRVHSGLRVVDPTLAAESVFDGASPLTERESELLRLTLEGLSVSGMAARVHLSPGTVRNHLSAAIGKTAAENRAQAARVAREKGWI
jgi:two-component system response regulator DesR